MFSTLYAGPQNLDLRQAALAEVARVLRVGGRFRTGPFIGATAMEDFRRMMERHPNLTFHVFEGQRVNFIEVMRIR